MKFCLLLKNMGPRIVGFFRLDDRHLRGSTTSDLKLPPEEDTDSIQDYVDGETAGKKCVN